MGFLHLSDHARNDLVAILGEFTGTFLFLSFAFGIAQVPNVISEGATAPTEPTTLRILYIEFGFGVSLAINC